MIKIENLTKKYSKQTVLEINSLEIPSGQTFGLIGNNGAGKTTLFSCLLDLIKPTKGKVINNDVEVSTSENYVSLIAKDLIFDLPNFKIIYKYNL